MKTLSGEKIKKGMTGTTGELKLQGSEVERLEQSVKNQKRITSFYTKLAEKVAKQAKTLEGKDGATPALRRQYLEGVANNIKSELNKIQGEVGTNIEQSIYNTALSVVDDNNTWMESVGMGVGGAFSHLPAQTVDTLILGKLYPKDWTLSAALWGDTASKMKDVNLVVAEGIALGKSAYEVAKDLEQYVDPAAKKGWEWSKVYPTSSKVIDYNAQRLSRTMISHAYQNSLVSVVKDNPFAEGIKWRSALIHDRTCKLCRERNGKIFPKDDLPLDHPNGLCTFIVELPSAMDVSNRIADWANGAEDPGMEKWSNSMHKDGPGVEKTKSKPKDPEVEKVKSKTGDPEVDRVLSNIETRFPELYPHIGVNQVAMNSSDFQGLKSSMYAYIDPKDPNTLYLNPKSWGPGGNIDEVIKDSLGFTMHPNIDRESLIAHELFHNLSLKVDESKIVNATVTKALSTGEIEAEIVKALEAKYGKGGAMTLKHMSDLQKASHGFSSYGGDTQQEFFAEALADAYKNGDKANKVSLDLLSRVKSEIADGSSTITKGKKPPLIAEVIPPEVKVELDYQSNSDKLYKSMYGDDGLTDSQKTAISNYTGDSYSAINGYLRKGKVTTSAKKSSTLTNAQIKSSAEEIKLALSNKLSRLPEDIITYRGVSSHLVGNFEAGKVISDDGLLSTSLDKHQALGFSSKADGVVMKIRAPKGTPALPATSITKESKGYSWLDEAEILLAPKQKMRMVSETTITVEEDIPGDWGSVLYKKGDTYREVTLEVVPENEELAEKKAKELAEKKAKELAEKKAKELAEKKAKTPLKPENIQKKSVNAKLTTKEMDQLLAKQVDMKSFEVEAKKWWDKLPPQERISVNEYTGNSYVHINGMRRKGKLGKDYKSQELEYKKHGDEIEKALSQAKLEKDTMVRRGSDVASLRGLNKKLFGDVKINKLSDITPEALEGLRGSVMKDKGFMSTSVKERGGLQGDIEYRILLPKGSKAAYLENTTIYKGEHEILLQAGSTMRITDAKLVGSKLVVYMENIV